MIGAAAMSLSSFTVCMNALRLNLFPLRDAGHDRPRKHHLTSAPAEAPRQQNQKEETTMEKTLDVKGMMCQHCEARVKKALEAVEGVSAAVADHNKGTAVVTLSAPVADEVLRKAVEDQDYEVTAVR